MFGIDSDVCHCLWLDPSIHYLYRLRDLTLKFSTMEKRDWKKKLEQYYSKDVYSFLLVQHNSYKFLSSTSFSLTSSSRVSLSEP